MALQIGVASADGHVGFVRVRRLPFRIGRSSKCDLSLNNSAQISRQHAKLIRSEDGVMLVLLGKNPSYLNGEPLQPGQATAIKHGDVIDFPECRLRVRELQESKALHESTASVPTVDRHAALVRKIAASLGVRAWRVEGIHDWLQQERRREVRIHYRRMELGLRSELSLDEIHANLDLLGRLLATADIKDIRVTATDPANWRSDPDLASG